LSPCALDVQRRSAGPLAIGDRGAFLQDGAAALQGQELGDSLVAALGKARYPKADRLLMTANCGSSNGARVHLWKRELQRFGCIDAKPRSSWCAFQNASCWPPCAAQNVSSMSSTSSLPGFTVAPN
jgi:hypothetical protein